MKKLVITGLIMLFGVMACSSLDTINEQGNVSVTTDDKNPALFIISPYRNITNQTYTYLVEGWAMDNLGVTGVYLARNGSTYRQVDGTTNWSTNISDLASGSNIIQAYALDKNGNTSLTQMVNIFVDTDAPVVSIISGPSSDLVTNNGFSITLNADKNYGYYSVYGLPFSQFSKGTINIDINETTKLKYYSSDGINTSSTQTVSYVIAKAIYVTTDGNDTNNGYEKDKPMLNIQKAIEEAVYYGISYIYVQAGTYTPGNGLNTSGVGIDIANSGISIVGGYDSSFIHNYGQSILDGTNGVGPIISGNNINNCVIDSFLIKRSSGNGVSISGDSNIITSDCTMLLNSSTGVSVSGSYNTINGTILGNSGNGVSVDGSYNTISVMILGNGGGVSVSGSYNTISGTVSGNNSTGVSIDGSYNTVSGTVSSNSGMGVYISSSSYNTTISGTVSSSSGTGVYIWYSSSNTISGTISGNNDRGVFMYCSSYNIINGIISNNQGYYGGGVGMSCSSYNTINGTVLGNNGGYGGGVCIWNGSHNTISGTISGNTANDYGGGVSIMQGSSNTISAIIFDNTSVGDGGGVRIEGSSYNTISGTISGNTTSGGGGGVYNNGSAYWTGSWGSGNTPDDWAGNAALP